MGCILTMIKRKCSTKVEPENKFIQANNDLTKEQRSVIKTTWHELRTHVAAVGINTFISLFESRPELQTAFKDFRGKDLNELRFTGLLRKHSLRVMATIDKCVIHLDDPLFISSSITELGMQHAKYAVPMEYIESILPPFLVTIKPYIEEHWCKDLEEAWERFFTIILFYMREGMHKYEHR